MSDLAKYEVGTLIYSCLEFLVSLPISPAEGQWPKPSHMSTGQACLWHINMFIRSCECIGWSTDENLYPSALVWELDILFLCMCIQFTENTVRIILVCSLQEGSSILLVNGRLNEGGIIKGF